MSSGVEVNRRLIFVNSASGAIERVVNIFVLVWLHQYLVKRISPQEYSLYAVLTAVLVFVPLLTTVLTTGLGRYMVEAEARGDERKVTQILSTMFPVLLVVSAGLMGMGALFASHIGSVLTIALDRIWDAQIMMLLMFFSVSLRLALAPFSVGLYVRQKFVLLNLLAAGRALVRLGMLFALLVGVGPRVLWVVVATVTADVVGLFLTLTISRRVLPALRFRRAEIRWRLVRVLTGFGFWNMVSLFAYMIRLSSDALILNKLGTAQNVTSFHLGRLPDTQIEGMVQKASDPLQPAMVALQATGEKQRLQNFYLRGGRYSLWVALFVATPFIIYRETFWSLYLGKSYHLYPDVGTVMALLLAAYWVTYPNVMISKVAHATGQVRPLAIRFILASLTNVALTVYLVGVLKMGAVGSALSTFLIAAFWEPIIMWRFSLKLLDLSFALWFKETIWLGMLPGAVAGLFSLAIGLVTHANSWLELAMLVACGCGVYIWVLWAVCSKPDERRDLFQIIAKIRSLGFTGARTAGAI